MWKINTLDSAIYSFGTLKNTVNTDENKMRRHVKGYAKEDIMGGHKGLEIGLYKYILY